LSKCLALGKKHWKILLNFLNRLSVNLIVRLENKKTFHLSGVRLKNKQGIVEFVKQLLET
jgi:hypothetical protein